MNSPISSKVAVFLLLVASVPAQASSFNINFDLAFDQISLTGSSTGVDAPALGNGWMPVDSMLEIQQSAAGQSALSGTLGIDAMLNPFMSLTGTFYLDLLFTDIDGDVGDDFGTGLSSPLMLTAAPNAPLVVTMEFGVTLAQLGALQDHLSENPGATIGEAVDAYNLANDPDIAVVFPGLMDDDDGVNDPVKLPLGVDLNGNGLDDAVRYFGQSLLLTAAESTSVDLDVNSTDFGLLLYEYAMGGDVIVDIVGSIDVMATGLEFHGGIVDATDPPFTFGNMDLIMSGGTPLAQSAPEPLTVALLGLGLAGVAGLRRRAQGCVALA